MRRRIQLEYRMQALRDWRLILVVESGRGVGGLLLAESALGVVEVLEGPSHDNQAVLLLELAPGFRLKWLRLICNLLFRIFVVVFSIMKDFIVISFLWSVDAPFRSYTLLHRSPVPDVTYLYFLNIRLGCHRWRQVATRRCGLTLKCLKHRRGTFYFRGLNQWGFLARASLLILILEGGRRSRVHILIPHLRERGERGVGFEKCRAILGRLLLCFLHFI